MFWDVHCSTKFHIWHSFTHSIKPNLTQTQYTPPLGNIGEQFFDIKNTKFMIFTPKHTNSHFFWHQPENFDTSTAGGAGDKYEVCFRSMSSIFTVFTGVLHKYSWFMISFIVWRIYFAFVWCFKKYCLTSVWLLSKPFICHIFPISVTLRVQKNNHDVLLIQFYENAGDGGIN